jgi:hypothetical protein
VADEIVDHEQRRNGQGNGDQAASEPGLLESGKPAAGGAQIAMCRMGTIGMPARLKTGQTNAITAMVDRMTFALPRAFKPSVSSPIDCC